MSKKKSDKDTIGYWFRLARERGIDLPVVLIFDPGAQAEAVYSQLSGRALAHTGNAAGEEPEALTHTVAEAAGALRNHAGLGGRLVANLLEAPPAGVVRWLLCLSGDHIGVYAFDSEELRYRAHTHYDQLPAVNICPCCARKKGPFPLVVGVDDPSSADEEIDLFLQVADTSQVARAMILTQIAANRRMPSAPYSSGNVEFPVGNGELVQILSDFYSDSPEILVEVLRAPGRERHTGRRWLLDTLRTGSGLKRLGVKVERLIGKEAAGRNPALSEVIRRPVSLSP